MPSNTRAFPDRKQPDIAFPLVSVPRRVDIDLPLDGTAVLGRDATRRVFKPTLSQVAAYPMRSRETELLRTGGSGRFSTSE